MSSSILYSWKAGVEQNNVLFELGYDDGFRVILVGLWRYVPGELHPPPRHPAGS